MAIAISLACAPLAPQETRLIRGTVTDAAGTHGIADAIVAVRGRSRLHARTDAVGRFAVRAPAGAVTLVATKLGFRPDTIRAGAHDVRLEFRLQPAPLALDPVIVAAAGPGEGGGRVADEVTLQLRPPASPQELLTVAPGLVIAQHAGGGKAEQIFLRGFDADHGTDVAVTVDGVPVNMVSHAHGQGYADLHLVIPELVEHVEVRKGPSRAADGDFATAGAVHLRLRERLPAATVQTEVGSFRTGNLYAAVPFGDRTTGGYVAAAGYRSDGPFRAPQGHHRLNGFATLTAPAGRMDVVAQLSAFEAAWNGSGQIPERAVTRGLIDRFGAIDDTEGGSTRRIGARVALRSAPAGGPADGGWRVQAYLVRYTFELFSNFTFVLDDAVNGDGIAQADDRWIGGLRADWRGEAWSGGIATRSDRAAVALDRQRARVRFDRITAADIAQDHVAAWADYAVPLAPAVRAVIGLRADGFRFAVRERGTGVRATAFEGLVSPKAVVTVGLAHGMTLFGTAATGFHSNDARAVVAGTGTVPVVPRAVALELGARRTGGRGTVGVAAWMLDLQSELAYVGDAGRPEPRGPTRRIGIELDARVAILPWLWADADVNLARGWFRDTPPDANRIPLAPGFTSTGGITARDRGPLSAALRYRALAARPADEAGDVMARGSLVWDLFGRWERGPLALVLAVRNVLDAEWNEAQFATTSRLPGEPGPVTELHFTPGAPRHVTVALEWRVP